ncbi:hypothetical protein PanWU01x14_287950 [Parasponia andersonii]|uniref:Uncharacterized protein n=1 Tax=Parasponia andersonii TaxID=3476 RepID=A0A2P5AYM2_PARAD|nr:hypothetical protein PanWU01x14_287950 [Parasponia andersonii]
MKRQGLKAVHKPSEVNKAEHRMKPLNQMYQSPSIATMVDLNSQLHPIKKVGISLSDCLSRMKGIFDQYAAIGGPMSYRDKLIKTFEGLCEEYGTFVTSIYKRPNRLSLKEVHIGE